MHFRLAKKDDFSRRLDGGRVIYLMGRRGHMHKVGIGSGGTADVLVLSFCSFMPSPIDCPLSSSSLCLLVCEQPWSGRKASLGRIFVFDPSLFVLATSGRGERQTFSVPISVFPSGRTEYQSEAAPNSQELRFDLVVRHTIPWERRKNGFVM